jgi:hypothetical protein
MKLKVKEFMSGGQRLESWDRTHDQKTTKTTLWGTMSWSLAGASLLFILISALLIANSSCSLPRGLSASSPVCVGGHLSVQSWLALVGVEFTILGLIIVPRIQSVTISKLLTWRLTHGGMPLVNLLNSQTTSPSWTKLCLGSRSTLLIRIFTFCTMITVSILYKFSFIQVGRVDAVALKEAKAPVTLGCDNIGWCNGVSPNFFGALSTSDSSSSFNTAIDPNTSSTPKPYYQVFGPSQDNIAYELNHGNLYLCTPTYYSRNKITPNTPDWNPPLLTPYSNPDGLRIITHGSHSTLDIFSSNGTLEILSGSFKALDQDSIYISKVTASIEICLGYASWSVNNTIKPSSYLQNPTDIACVPENFNLTDWSRNTSSQFSLSVLRGLDWSTVNNLPLQTVALNVILATLNHMDSMSTLDNIYASMLSKNISTPTPPQCSKFKSSRDTTSPWVAIGLIPSHGTGMTQLGVVLQALIIALSVCTLILLFIPVLPLVTEWPAQWLGLVYGLSPSKVQAAVEGTSAGRNAAKDSNWGQCTERKEGQVWLSSGGGDVIEGCPYLILSPEKGMVRMGRNHV